MPPAASTNKITRYFIREPLKIQISSQLLRCVKNFLLTYKSYAALRNFSAPCIWANSEFLEAPMSASVISLFVIGVTHHFQPKSSHARHLVRGSQQTHLADIEVSQYLRADAVAARIPLCGLLASRIQGGARAQILRCLATMQQHQYAGRRMSDFLHGLIHADRMRMIGLFQKIHHRKRFVYAHQSLGIMANITLHQGHMSALRGLVHVGHQFEFAISSLHLAPCHTLDQFLMLAAVLDEIGNRANF